MNGKPVTFDISVPAGDTVAFKSDGAGGTFLKVVPQVLGVGAPAPATGVEGAAIHLGFSDTVTGASLASFVIGGIPDGAVITDGTPGHTYASRSSADGSVDVASWNLSTLTITPADAANFTLKALVTAIDGDGYDYSLPETEIVTVNPAAPTVAPVAESGIEGRWIALNLGTTANGLPGDTNSLASLVVSTIPIGATLNDGHGHSFTASVGSTSIDVHDWALSGLTIKPADATSFTLHVAATEHDAEGNLSAPATGIEAVSVTPDLPVIVGETDPAEQAVIVVTPGVPIVLAPGTSNNTLGLNTETFNSQPEGSHSNNGAGHGNFYKCGPQRDIFGNGTCRCGRRFLQRHFGSVHRPLARRSGHHELFEHRRRRHGNHRLRGRRERLWSLLGIGRLLQQDRFLPWRNAGRLL